MSVPFFSDFTKKTKDYFKRDKYALGQVVEISNKCCDDIRLKTKISTGNDGRVKPKFVATLKTANNREIELSEDLRKGLNIKIKMPKIYGNISLESEHSNNDVEVKAKYRPSSSAANSFYNTKVSGYYAPDSNGSRVCVTKGEFAVGDDQLNLCVGGDITIEDKAKNDSPFEGVNARVKSYTLGFLYKPTKDTQYSVIYTPDNESNGMEYSFTCYRKLSDKCSLAAKADGKVDTKLTGFPPVISIAGGWTLGANYFQGFANSRKEWGLAYKVKVSDSATVNFGVASYLNDEQRVNTQFGYKLQI